MKKIRQMHKDRGQRLTKKTQDWRNDKRWFAMVKRFGRRVLLLLAQQHSSSHQWLQRVAPVHAVLLQASYQHGRSDLD